ncbi:OPA3-domain-containing protein [Thelephora ganbajun]|uniref:OPA3-domain-containing protein n=1 Tax=Thelephora ganbajun TaxID=370292 RepID=A0ACB6ZW44_THEGA|nr:OPA3-domain-containing protein [Thelephora ganbajun]
MASAKIATLVIRTLAKPISNQIKTQAREHPTFRSICVNLAQSMYRTEVKLRTNLLGEPANQHVRPLSEARAIENGANALAEGFLFGVAALLIIGETWRSSRSQSKRRDDVNDKLEDLSTRIQELSSGVDQSLVSVEERLEYERQRNDELGRILERVVEIGLRGGWAEFEGTPLMLPRIQPAPPSPVDVNSSIPVDSSSSRSTSTSQS